MKKQYVDQFEEIFKSESLRGEIIHWKENKQNAQHDSLTGLHNRLYFQQHLLDCIQIAKNFNHKFALLFIDLNGFKRLNDTYGHDTGDFILKAIAEET